MDNRKPEILCYVAQAGKRGAKEAAAAFASQFDSYSDAIDVILMFGSYGNEYRQALCQEMASEIAKLERLELARATYEEKAARSREHRSI